MHRHPVRFELYAENPRKFGEALIAIRQEIDGFVSQLGRQPAESARIVDTSGSVAVATRVDQTIRLEHA